MISASDFHRIAFTDEKPTLLSVCEMRAKLIERGINAESTLGKQALSGGPLYTPDGHFRLATPGNVALSAAEGTPPAPGKAPAGQSTLLDRVAAIYAGDEPKTETEPGTPSGSTPAARTLADLAADAYCTGGVGVVVPSAVPATPAAGAADDDLIARAVSAYLDS